MKKVTSVTFWNDAVGKRLSITYSEIDESTGKITSDNKRVDRIITDEDAISALDTVASFAQKFVDKISEAS